MKGGVEKPISSFWRAGLRARLGTLVESVVLVRARKAGTEARPPNK